jgi:tetratricopeptide (TPR) repeat protein
MDQVSFLSNRYVLQEPLGNGGMGSVYRAVDRLTQETVALKRILSVHQDTSDKLRLALAREFRTLASLRHPNIISVMDYGFDSERKPYITMELLHNAQTFEDAAQNCSFEEKIGLLLQLLQALVYLHRRGVIHCDLKPANVLVNAEGIVKVLDFGIARGATRTKSSMNGVAGTIAYMSPELLMEQPASVESDLYACGVVAYEMFLDKLPFACDNLGALVLSIMTQVPNLEGLDDSMAGWIGRLLAKEPEDRYPDAQTTIEALCQASGQPPPTETHSHRESFLQAAQFVGRAAELDCLRNALQKAREGKGSSWLIGGESGVGKSRLLDELRIHALIEGVMVLRGQVTNDVGRPYEPWRQPIRRLCLAVDLNDLEAGILKDLVPDIETLLGRPVSEPPHLEGGHYEQRLYGQLIRLIQRAAAQQPLLLFMEDLQWSRESLDFLRILKGMVADLPILIVGSYRHDERPQLVEELAGMQTILLSRFTIQEITTLSAAMLGTAGHQPQVVDLLQRETEGNAFFLIEVARSLADCAGCLDAVSNSPLPPAILTGGMQAVIMRRLTQISESAQHLLQYAAVAGRQLDLQVMSSFGSTQEFDASLVEALNAGILEIADGHWRFAHDKLREAILKEIPPVWCQQLHAEVAQAYETIYPNQVELMGRLAEYWRGAGKDEKELDYLLRAGRNVYDMDSEVEAAKHFSRALELLPKFSVERAEVLIKLGNIYFNSDYTLASSYLQQGIEHAMGLNAHELVVEGWYIEARHFDPRNLTDIKIYAEVILNLSRQINYERGQVLALRLLGLTEFSVEHLQEALRIACRLDDKGLISGALINLGFILVLLGHYQEARHCFEEQLQADSAYSIPAYNGFALRGLAFLAAFNRNLEEAVSLNVKADYVFQSVGLISERLYTSLATSLFFGLDYKLEDAITLIEDTVDQAQSIGITGFDFWASIYRVFVLYQQKEFPVAQILLEILAQELPENAPIFCSPTVWLGHLARKSGSLEKAQQLYLKSLKAAAADQYVLIAHALIGYAGTLKNPHQAVQWLGAALSVPCLDIFAHREAEELLSYFREALPHHVVEQELQTGFTMSLQSIRQELLVQENQ